jgi:hypothetical protein
MTDKLDFPATHRNAEAICQVLLEHLPGGNVLEIASGSGQHVVCFGQNLPCNQFTPSDPDPAHIASIGAWLEENQLDNVLPPALLDTTSEGWTKGQNINGLPETLAAILCINMIHIAPIAAAQGLFAGASKRLSAGGLLYLYGPFLETGSEDAPSNLAFDRDLQCRNEAWGVRTLPWVKQMANQADFDFEALIPMPANNFSVLFRKRAD